MGSQLAHGAAAPDHKTAGSHAAETAHGGHVNESAHGPEYGAHGADHGAHGADHAAHGADHGAHGADHAAHGADHADHAHGPLHQFEIQEIIPLQIGDVNISFTNSALWMVIAVVVATLFLTLSMRSRAMVPGRMQSMAEVIYSFVANLVRDVIGGEDWRSHMPFVFTLFMYILLGNALGMLPYSFTITSHIAVTFGLAVTSLSVVTLVGLYRHGFRFFTLFMPSAAPPLLLPVVIPIEVISYLARLISLSVRLFANMMAGHTAMKVFGALVISFGVVGGVAPLIFAVALTGLELLVAALQAYVFTLMTCMYLHDAVHLH